jgi:hypothetical protein
MGSHIATASLFSLLLRIRLPPTGEMTSHNQQITWTSSLVFSMVMLIGSFGGDFLMLSQHILWNLRE